MFEVYRLERMTEDEQMDWFNNELRQANTSPPSEGKLSRISNLMDLATGRARTAEKTSQDEFREKLENFVGHSQTIYNDISRKSYQTLNREEEYKLVPNGDTFVWKNLSVPTNEIRNLVIKKGKTRKLLSSP
jgi:hypothetical protein